MSTSLRNLSFRTLMMKSGPRRSTKEGFNSGTTTVSLRGDIIQYGTLLWKSERVRYSLSTRSKLTSALGCALILFTAQWSLGQLEQPDRYEIKLANQEPGFRVASASSDGLVLHRFVRSNQDNFLELIRLDTTFHEMWQGSINIDRSMIFVGGLARDSYVYFLFHSISTKAFELIRVDHDDGQYRTYSVNSFIRFGTTEVRVTKQDMVIDGNFKRVTHMLFYDLSAH